MSIFKKLSDVNTYKRDLSVAEMDAIFHDGTVEWGPMIKEISKRTHLPRFICEMVYAAETKIMEDIGLLY